MKKLGIALLLISLVISLGFNVFMANYIGKQNSSARSNLVFGDANSPDTYFTLHNVAKAHEISKGKGIKVGILDDSFGYNRHPDLYSGGADFAGKDSCTWRQSTTGTGWRLLSKRLPPKPRYMR